MGKQLCFLLVQALALSRQCDLSMRISAHLLPFLNSGSTWRSKGIQAHLRYLLLLLPTTTPFLRKATAYGRRPWAEPSQQGQRSPGRACRQRGSNRRSPSLVPGDIAWWLFASAGGGLLGALCFRTIRRKGLLKGAQPRNLCPGLPQLCGDAALQVLFLNKHSMPKCQRPQCWHRCGRGSGGTMEIHCEAIFKCLDFRLFLPVPSKYLFP